LSPRYGSPPLRLEGRKQFFFEKKTKKLLSVTRSTNDSWLDETPKAIVESFLFLFFKKEILSFLSHLIIP
jgi:hypothetical protein